MGWGKWHKFWHCKRSILRAYWLYEDLGLSFRISFTFCLFTVILKKKNKALVKSREPSCLVCMLQMKLSTIVSVLVGIFSSQTENLSSLIYISFQIAILSSPFHKHQQHSFHPLVFQNMLTNNPNCIGIKKTKQNRFLVNNLKATNKIYTNGLY